MAAAGGINAQLGFAEEVTPGVAVTPNRSSEFDKETLMHDLDRIEHHGLRTGRKFLGTTNYVVGRENVKGGIDLMLQNKGQALWYKHALGNVVTTTPMGATLARNHKVTVGAIDGKSLTLQVGFADDTGTSRAKTISGAKINKWSVEGKENEFPVLGMDFDGISATTATALAVASYPTSLMDFSPQQTSVKLAGAEVDCSDYKFEFDNGLATDRYYLRSTTPGQKKEQLEGDSLRAGKGSLTLAFPDLTAYNRYVNNNVVSLQVTITGAFIEGTIPYSVDYFMPAIRFDGKTPNVDGVGLIPIELNFTILDNQTTDGPIVVNVVNDSTSP